MTSNNDTNLHAGCVVLGTSGVLICGASGSGKSSLALKLIAQTRADGKFAALVCDDQTLLAGKNGQLIARCPLSIAGKVEIRGHGIVDMPNLPSSIVHLVVELVTLKKTDRMPKRQSTTISGIELPLVRAQSCSTDQALSVVFAALEDFNR